MPLSRLVSFHNYFDRIPATTKELKEAAYRLRYRIYCVELSAWHPSLFPDGMENDEFDASSDHYLIMHKKTGVYAAHTRLILTNRNDPSLPLPIEIYSQIAPNNPLAHIPREQVAEASRFCVCNAFKRRQGEHNSVMGVNNNTEQYLNTEQCLVEQEKERRTYPHIMIALLNCLLRMSAANGITHWYAFMEPSLIRLMAMLGIQFIIIGPDVQYHGLRYPCCIAIADLLAGTSQKSPEIFEFLIEDLSYGQGLKGEPRRIFWNQ
jgi:N-acyl amino acid synthase of PEP-CTERM/exosortase system